MHPTYYVTEDDNSASVFGGTQIVNGEPVIPCLATFPYRGGAAQAIDEATRLANLLNSLDAVVRTLRDHPDVERGNSRVHFAYYTAKNALSGYKDGG